MSVSNSVAQKSVPESERRGEENEMRLGDIRLPPDDEGGSSNAFGVIRSQDDSRLSDRLSEKSQASIFSAQDEDEESGNITEHPKTSPIKKVEDITKLAMDSHLGLISEISLPHSPPAPVDSTKKSNSSPLSIYPREREFSPKTGKLSCLSTPASNENVLKLSSVPFTELESSLGHESPKMQHHLPPNINPLAMSFTSEIPLPGQSLENIPPPLPNYHPTSPSSKFCPIVKNQENNSVNVHKYDSNLNKKLGYDNLGLDNESYDKSGTKLDIPAVALTNCKNFSSAMQICDVSSVMELDKKKIDDSRYSPSRLDSDEENQEFAAIKPKVLGKEQAKKRLMAFSLSKQPSNTIVKKQNKLAVGNKTSKEKPPNPNKSAGVQEQFRATISAIEEEKKRMMQNMPNYLFLQRNNLSKITNAVIPNTAQTTEKTSKDEDSDPESATKSGYDKDDKEINRSRYSQSSPGRSKSSRQRRSSSRRSSSRSRRQTKEREEKSDKKDSDSLIKKMDSLHDWKSFVEAGFELDSDFRRLKLRFEEKQRRKDRRRSRSPDERFEFKPIFNYLKKGSRIMTALQAKSSNPGANITVPFQEKTVKFTRTKPMITWSENPSYATDFYMPKQMLLENCDKSVSSILYDIMEQRCETHSEMKKPKQRFWYPQVEYLIETQTSKLFDSMSEQDKPDTMLLDTQAEVDGEEIDKESFRQKLSKSKRKREASERVKSSNSDPAKRDGKDENKSLFDNASDDDEHVPVFKPRERRVSLVNDDYMSDAESDKVPMKEMFVGDLKVKLDLGLNSVKVRSKWDSDYEGEETERDEWKKSGKRECLETVTPATHSAVSSISVDPGNLVPVADKNIINTEVPCDSSDLNLESTYNQVNIPPLAEMSQSSDLLLDEPKAKLASEYEEFMKMVAFEAGDSKNANSNEGTSDKAKTDFASYPTCEKIVADNMTNKKVETTDWDQESDREEKPQSKKVDYVKEDSSDSFSLLLSGYDSKKQRKSKSPAKKKLEKTKGKEKDKKLTKNRKKKYREESSSESSSESSDSDSDSDSESDSDSDSSDSEDERRKRKKRKVKKLKKKYSSTSDSESESDSRSSKSKKSKLKKKKTTKNKRNISGESSDANDETQSAMLKQLDFKKQQIIKKIEEIDSIGGKGSKKKEKKKTKKTRREESSESDETDRDSSKKDRKRKAKGKSPGKVDKSKVKSKDAEEKSKSQKKPEKCAEGSDESLSESEDKESTKGRRRKKSKRQKSSSESSSDDETKENRRSSKLGKNAKGSKKRKADYSSSSESDSDSDLRRSKKKLKKKKKKKRKSEIEKVLMEKQLRDWNDHLLSDGPDFKTGNSLTDNVDEDVTWSNDKSTWDRHSKSTLDVDKDGNNHKDLGDWEESSPEESPRESRSRDSSWDEELPKSSASQLLKDQKLTEMKKKAKVKDQHFIAKELIHDEKDKFLNDFNLDSKHDLIFNDNSLSNLGQELSRDRYSSENSASLQLFPSLSKESQSLDPVDYQFKRNFQGIGADFRREEVKPSKEELYSPGHTESDLSDGDEKKENKNEGKFNRSKEDIYDPLNCDSDASADGNKDELGSIPLPHVSDILLPGEIKKEVEEEKSSKSEAAASNSPSGNSFGSTAVKEATKSDFIALPLATDIQDTNKNFGISSEKFEFPGIVNKKRMISVKLQQKFQCKVASVFQSDSEEEEVVEPAKKAKTAIGESETALKSKTVDKENEKAKVERSEGSKKEGRDSGRQDDRRKTEDSRNRDRSRDRSRERDRRSRGSSRKEGSSDRYKEYSDRYSSPRRRRSRSPDSKFSVEERDTEHRRRNADSYSSSMRTHSDENRKGKDLDSRTSPPVKSSSNRESELSKKSDEVTETDVVRPIPVLTGLDVRAPDGLPWGRSHLLDPDIGYSCDRLDLMDPSHLDSYKLYGSHDGKEETALYNLTDKKYIGRYDRNYERDVEGSAELDVLLENRIRKDKRKSRSRSSSPRKRRRSKTPERRRSPRNRSPRHRSTSPRRRGRSPFSPRRRGSPRRKSPSRRYRSSRSPERKKSRSPRKRRHSPSRRSRSVSPRKHRGRDSPRRRSLSPGKSLSPRKDGGYPVRDIGVMRNLIQVIGPNEEKMESPMATTQTPKYDSPMGFTRSLADSTISDSELSNAFYSREYSGEYGGQNYPEEVTVNNLITLQNHDADKRTDSPKRLTLDQRIEIELGVPPGPNDQYQMPPQPYSQYPEVHSNQYQNSYPCDNSSNGNQSFYPNQSSQMGSDFNGQFFNGQQPPPNFGQFHQYPRHNPPTMQNSVLQVGNIMEVVPTLPGPPPHPPPVALSKGQIMQVGNVLQVVPSPKPTQGTPHGYGMPQSHLSASTPLSPSKGQKVLPQSTMPVPPNPEAIINPLIKAIQLEREKRKKEKEKRRAEREARRKARQLRREAKLMAVNEKLKKSVQDEGLMLGQEVEEDELLEEIEQPSPPIPVEIITDSSQNSLPAAGKGILITAGFIPKPSSEKKEVKFADGICPGEGTSTSGGEDRGSPPPKPKLPKEKRYKKKKTKLKKKVKVHIIRQVIQDDEDEDEDDLSPPPPPPGDPPPVFFARFPFGSKAQYPVYQTQTTTTTLTTVQFPTQSYQ